MASPSRPTRTFTKKEISQLFLTAKRVVRQQGLDILLAPSNSSFGRLLVVTPAKIGPAPDRNRVRRRLKALFYEKKLSALPFDCAVIVKSTGIHFEYSQLEVLINQAYQKIKSPKEPDAPSKDA